MTRHLYAYVGNNPINRIDPTGHDPWEIQNLPNNPRLKKGDRGGSVYLLQRLLIENGFPLPKYGVDGIFGKETLRALNQFKKHAGLDNKGANYGVAGNYTFNALLSRKYKKVQGAIKTPPQGTGKTSPPPPPAQKGNPQLAAWCHDQMYRPKSAGEIAEYTADGVVGAYLAYETLAAFGIFGPTMNQYKAPPGGGGISAQMRIGQTNITFGHGGRHLEELGLNLNRVNDVIARDVIKQNLSQGQFYKGLVEVDGIQIQYHSFGLGNNTINIGTYYNIP